MEIEAWNFFEDILPPEVAEIVFSFLSIDDIVYVSLVCKPWNDYFDTKDIWKKITEHHYGELSPKNVDLAQSFRWKRIFIMLHNAHSWAKTLKGTTMTYLSPRETPDSACMSASGQYIHTMTSWIEIKMAGKLVQVKRNPLTIDEKQWIPRSTLPGVYPTVLHPLEQCVLASRDCKYLVRGDSSLYLVDSEKLASLDVGDYKATQLIAYKEDSSPTYFSTDCMATFNSRFVVLINRARELGYGSSGIYQLIFDLRSNCECVSTFYKDEQRNERVSVLIRISTPNGAITVFASELDPDLIVFFLAQFDEERSTNQEYFYYPKIVIWKHGKGLQVQRVLPFKNFTDDTVITNFSEHVIDEHHWLCFDMGNFTRIIDLNNFNNKFKLDLIPHRLWIPKKNKIILASSNKITVFDLSLNRWTSRMTCPNMVCAMTLNKSARILLVADNEKVHAFHWETGKLIGSVQHSQHHNFTSIDTLHITYDQILIINGRLFLKTPSKCNM